MPLLGSAGSLFTCAAQPGIVFLLHGFGLTSNSNAPYYDVISANENTKVQNPLFIKIHDSNCKHVFYPLKNPLISSYGTAPSVSALNVRGSGFFGHATQQAHGRTVGAGAATHALRCCFFMVASLRYATACGSKEFDFLGGLAA